MSTMEHDSQPLARSVFAGLAPSTPLPATHAPAAAERDRRASKALFGTGVVLVGAMTVMNLTGQVAAGAGGQAAGEAEGHLGVRQDASGCRGDGPHVRHRSAAPPPSLPPKPPPPTESSPVTP